VRVITDLFAATVRHRRPILLAALVPAAAHAAALRWWPWFFALSVVLVVVLVVLMVAGWSQPKPRTLTVRPERHVFEAPAGAAPVYAALCTLTVATGQLGSILRDPPHSFDLVWTAVWLLVAARWMVLAWDGLGVRLSPDGIRNRDVFGTVTAPWLALDRDVPPVAAPGQPNVLLTFARPDLVRLRGVVLSRRLLRADTVDAPFLAEVLRHYLTHPDARRSIGTPAELSRLLALLP
jgi:hypothetical protein